jgi:hypothetical protein
MILAGCWRPTSAPIPAIPATPAPAPTSVSLAAEDAPLARDDARIDEYLAGDDAFMEKGAFAAVEIVGWTPENALVYRSAICDPDELGARGPYCEVEVCTCSAEECHRDSASCDFRLSWDMVVENDDKESLQKEPIAEIRTAEAAHGRLVGGAAASVTLKANAERVWLQVGPMEWQAFEAGRDWDTGEIFSFSSIRVTAGRESPDGRCVGTVGTGSVSGRYEGVHGNIRFTFASVHCNH